MSETGQGTGNTRRTAPLDTICDFVRQTLETVSDAITPPEPARHHFRESSVEFLRGINALIDHGIDRMSRKTQSGTRVNVD